MTSQEFQPSPLLCPFVQSYWTITSMPDEKAIFRFAPDGHPEIFFNLSGRLKFSLNSRHSSYSTNYGICGQFNQNVDLDISNSELSFFIKLRPSTLSCFFPKAAEDLANGIYDLNALKALYRELLDIYNVDENINLLIQKTETWLFQQLQISTNYELTNQLILHIQQAYKSPINEILSCYGLSKRRLQQIFKSEIGISPKQYQRLFRFRKAMKELKNTPHKESFVYSLGYYDWSHFSKDMYYYFELSPSDYVYQLFQSGSLINIKR